MYCNNCGKDGHVYTNCKIPITSIGIVAYRINKDLKLEYLMIRRRDTLGFIDFVRGKYSLSNKEYIMNMLKQMTVNEKEILKTQSFSSIWIHVWGNKYLSTQYKNEEIISKDKFNKLKNGVYIKNEFVSLATMIEESKQYDTWTEPEWGFPKGRHNFQENDYDCALREFKEETGYNSSALVNIQNMLPFEEIFTGSNYKSYKHKYYVCRFLGNIESRTDHMNFEVSKVEWKTFEESIESIRYYNLEKIRLITNIHMLLSDPSYVFA